MMSRFSAPLRAMRPLAIAAFLSALAVPCLGQVTLQTAVNLALKNSPKVRAAQADLDKARAARGEAQDVFVPVVTTTAGYGQSTGAPLGLPVVFSIQAQSLVFSFSQRDYIRSAQQSVIAAQYALHSAQTEVVEDTTNTYLALDSAIKRKAVMQQELAIADKLVTVTQERIAAGVDPKVEFPQSRRTATQIRLAALQLDDELAQDTAHLATLTGLPAAGMVTEPESIPAFTDPAESSNRSTGNVDSEAIKAAFATAQAKQYAAFGDERYLLRPQISFVTSYSRVDTGLSAFASYYPGFNGTPGHPNSQNALGYGIQMNIPLLDFAHRSKARESAADAARSFADAEQQRGLFRESRAKLQHSAVELHLQAQLATDDQEIAQDQLEAIDLQMRNAASTAGPPPSPKDQLNAQLSEREKYLQVLNANLQLRQTQVNLLRQTDTLGTWVISNPVPAVTPTVVNPVDPGANLPGTPGVSPATTPRSANPPQ